jgi:hypothetical protein
MVWLVARQQPIDGVEAHVELLGVRRLRHVVHPFSSGRRDSRIDRVLRWGKRAAFDPRQVLSFEASSTAEGPRLA